MLVANSLQPPKKPEMPPIHIEVEPQGIDVDNLMQRLQEHQSNAAENNSPAQQESKPGRFRTFVTSLGERMLSGLVSKPTVEESSQQQPEWNPQPPRAPIMHGPLPGSTPHTPTPSGRRVIL